jgi:hypothetical protein
MWKVSAVTALMAVLSYFGQPLAGQSPSGGEESNRNQKNIPADSPDKATRDQRGTKESPLVIDTEGHQYTPAEAKEKSREKADKHSIDEWTLRWAAITAGSTVVLMLVGIGGVIAATRTLRAIEQQAGLMETAIQDARKSNADNTKDVRASIAEAVRSAKAMEVVAESMAATVESVKTSVVISREIADTQKLVTELQSRPYLSASFDSALFQDENHIFEVQTVLRNHGNTPAYDVTFSAVAQIVPIPIPDDFPFFLPPNSAGGSSSLIAPGMTKILVRAVPTRVRDDQVRSIQLGIPPLGLAMWGVVKYRDAFMKNRQLRFAYLVTWRPWIKGMDTDKDGNVRPEQTFRHDTTHHNDSD